MALPFIKVASHTFFEVIDEYFPKVVDHLLAPFLTLIIALVQILVCVINLHRNVSSSIVLPTKFITRPIS